MMRSGRSLASTVVGIALVASGIMSAPIAAAKETDWTSFAGGIAPGATIAQVGETGGSACTLGFIAGDPITHKLYGITAGHCDHSSTMPPTVLYTDANSPDIARPLGTYTASRQKDGTTTSGKPGDLPTYTDAGIIGLRDGTAIASFKLAGVYPVRGVVEDYQDLPYGTEVCKYGMRTGETCGPITVASKYTITAEVHAIHGDSGSPLYRKNNDGTVDLIGILSNGSDTEFGEMNRFFWAGPLLRALKLQVCGCGPN